MTPVHLAKKRNGRAEYVKYGRQNAAASTTTAIVTTVAALWSSPLFRGVGLGRV